MTDFRALCEELVSEIQALRRAVADEMGGPSPEPSVIARARAALAEQPVGQSRRCIYNPVQIAECGGPCEQIGPEACDCGALWVDQDTEQPVGPTDEDLNDTYWTAWHKHLDRTNSVLHSVGLRAVLARWGKS